MPEWMKHFYVICVVTTLWTWFFLLGLRSDYYQDWTWLAQLVFVDVLPLFAMILLSKGLILLFKSYGLARSSLIVAFYFSVPFFLYDYAYLVAYKDHGAEYLFNYWYLTGFSLLPWIVFPIRARLMSRR
ncbi:hypothetical protein [Hydrocarboniclastica marina]|uniref:Uncharacterized protein n=1 Tax=Hydrocarboniclastica marina TaxID=2259620 RepID=A0A4P7XG69_9ALTE|nr:hypothetical protein [Hydrocarboniclastica marina]MAL96821.1 hypothetical protein [Alteromonadaceae bacterium]QCF25946.1 hypothetical protein soil367_08445 [Hydrocarboniclastica marina]|tara:strand:- start:598 stop:984 length:387 start_codon:yes stop_codon:yes gene_type:complete